MASQINASNSGFGGIVSTGDSSGVLQLQTAGTTAVTLDTSQNATFAGKVTSAGALTLASNGTTTAVTIDTSQNVGIGTTSPSAKLDVRTNTTGDTNINIQNDYSGAAYAANLNLLAANTSGSYYNSIYSKNSAGTITWKIDGAGTADTFRISTGSSSTERMRITSTGNVGIGNDNPTGYNNAFTAITTSSYLPLFAGNTNTSATGPGIIVAKWLNSNATSNVLMQFLINGVATGSGQINANGASAAAFGSYSDARLKENIQPLLPQLDNILALKPSEFDYKDGSGHQIGFIAQEMQEVYPDVVSEGENDMLTITGWSKTEARLVKAIQELKEIVDAQAERIKALEAK